MIIDKNGVIPTFTSASPKMIEIGCGESKISKDHIGIDVRDLPGVDIVGDAIDTLKELPNQCVNEIYSSHFFEHIDDAHSLLSEVARVLKDDGKLITVVPHFSNPYFYSDPTHRNFFGLYTFCYYCDDNIFRRKVPSYCRIEGLRLADVHLVFKSPRPHYISHMIRRTIGYIFNSSVFLREVYENSFSSIIPCYSIKYIVRKSRS